MLVGLVGGSVNVLGAAPVASGDVRPAGAPAAAVAVVAGCAALAVRPVLIRSAPDPTAAIVVLFLVLGVVGAAWPIRAGRGDRPAWPGRGDRRGGATIAGALAVGVGAFVLGRVLGGGSSPAPFTLRVVALNSLAAVAEEAFFRRLAWSALSAAGPAAAVVGSAVLFAVVHVTVYGAWVLPIDVAAGLVLGWQRWASGSWAAPAVTHVVANLLVVL